MAGFDLDVFIPLPPEPVFDFATDPANAARVVEGVTSCEVLTGGPMGAGTRLRETRTMHGKEATAELEVVEHERPHRHVVVADVHNIRVQYAYRFEREGDGTRVSLSCRVEGRGIKRVLAPLVAAVMKREDGDHLERLRAAIG
jgi:carbon monoxide dehydrogenase subunit G